MKGAAGNYRRKNLVSEIENLFTRDREVDDPYPGGGAPEPPKPGGGKGTPGGNPGGLKPGGGAPGIPGGPANGTGGRPNGGAPTIGRINKHKCFLLTGKTRRYALGGIIPIPRPVGIPRPGPGRI